MGDQNSEKADTQFSEPRVHCPEERSKAKEVEHYRYTCADGDTIETVFRKIFSVNQLNISGAVSDLCEEYGTCHVRTVRLVLAGQSDPLFEPARLLIMTPTPSIEKFLHKKIYCKVQGTSGKVFTTGSSDNDLYGCRIPENS